MQVYTQTQHSYTMDNAALSWQYGKIVETLKMNEDAAADGDDHDDDDW